MSWALNDSSDSRDDSNSQTGYPGLVPGQDFPRDPSYQNFAVQPLSSTISSAPIPSYGGDSSSWNSFGPQTFAGPGHEWPMPGVEVPAGSSNMPYGGNSAYADSVLFDTTHRKSSLANGMRSRRTSVKSSFSLGSQTHHSGPEVAIVDPSALTYMAPPPNGFPMDHFTHNTGSPQHLDFGNGTRMAHNFVQPYWDASADAGLASAVKQDVFGQEVLGYTPVSPTHPFYDAQVLNGNVASPDWSRKHEDPARQYGFPTIVPRPAEQRRLSQSHARPASRASAAQVEKSQHVPEREGRFRTHQYYSAKPREDGYYYCPYKDCSHKPTKLKCNYEFVCPSLPTLHFLTKLQ